MHSNIQSVEPDLTMMSMSGIKTETSGSSPIHPEDFQDIGNIVKIQRISPISPQLQPSDELNTPVITFEKEFIFSRRTEVDNLNSEKIFQPTQTTSTEQDDIINWDGKLFDNINEDDNQPEILGRRALLNPQNDVFFPPSYDVEQDYPTFDCNNFGNANDDKYSDVDVKKNDVSLQSNKGGEFYNSNSKIAVMSNHIKNIPNFKITKTINEPEEVIDLVSPVQSGSNSSENTLDKDCLNSCVKTLIRLGPFDSVQIKTEPANDVEYVNNFELEQPKIKYNPILVNNIKGSRATNLKLNIPETFVKIEKNLNPIDALISTPDVLKSLEANNNTFSLIDYVDPPNDVEYPIVDEDECLDLIASKSCPKERNDEIKQEVDVAPIFGQGKVTELNEEAVFPKGIVRRKRGVWSKLDAESDTSDTSDEWVDDEKNDATFTLEPRSASKRRRYNSSTSRGSVDFSSNRISKNHSMTKDEDSSDPESVASSVDKYRELRDRNNEASRRSRMNRKTRELEMKKLADDLEVKNQQLKDKADLIQREVLKFRELLKRTLSKRKPY